MLYEEEMIELLEMYGPLETREMHLFLYMEIKDKVQFKSFIGQTYMDHLWEELAHHYQNKYNGKVIKTEEGIFMLNPDYKDPSELKDDPVIWIEEDHHDILDPNTKYFQSFEEVEEYLFAIPKEKWDEFFNLIPRMEIEEDYTYPKSEDDKSPYPNTNKLYSDFIKLYSKTGLYIRFNWAEWEYGRTIENDLEKLKSERFAHLPMLLTAIVRNNRFCEGVLLAHLQEKFILNIIKAMKFKYYKKLGN